MGDFGALIRAVRRWEASAVVTELGAARAWRSSGRKLKRYRTVEKL